jgi:acetoin:2,6-dichlorophenolindophenol oxidoreductase subunit beta
MTLITTLDSLNSSLRRAMAADERVILIGEDILDPYGGAFKVTRGLSSAFPDRVLASPISEAGMVGLAAGMALRGLRPVVEIMFGDFITLAADQLINHAAKFRWMYNDQVRVPLVVRTPMGGRRGYGPTHSQTLEKLFLGVPGLTVLAPSHLVGNSGAGPGDLLEWAVLGQDDPVVFIENKLQYLLPVMDAASLPDLDLVNLDLASHSSGGSREFLPPTISLRVRGTPAPVITLAAYGYMAELARQAQLALAYEFEIFTELVVPTRLAPFDLQGVIASASRTQRLLVIEEGAQSLGWGSEVLAQAVEHENLHLRCARRLAAKDLPVAAASHLESGELPGVSDIVQLAKKMV